MVLLERKEFHPFEAAGSTFLYLVPSAGVVRLDDVSLAVLGVLETGPEPADDILQALEGRFSRDQVRTSVEELVGIRAIGRVEPPAEPVRTLPVLPLSVPLTTMVLNVTSKCNLACTYCYEYGEDRVVDTEATLPRFLDEATARSSVDFMFAESGSNEAVNLTFFGGETLLNFPVLRSTLTYARERAEAEGKAVRFSLTTNATLLRPEVIEWLVENDVGVTVSIDGPKDVQDRFRVFHNGKGSYDVVLPKIRELIRAHTRMPVGARVTLTRGNLDVVGIFRHLTEEVGFREVGFAPVTTSMTRDYAIEESGYASMLDQFRTLAWEFVDWTAAGRHHGFSNVRETVEEIHKGVSKAYPCGAGLGLVGVATNGEAALCHRFAGSDEHRVGSVGEGIDRKRQEQFLEKHHLRNKPDCASCWARPLCAGGCYHEAHTRYGDTVHANLHYCDWIRSWTHSCLEVYGELSERAPEWLIHLDAR